MRSLIYPLLLAALTSCATTQPRIYELEGPSKTFLTVCTPKKEGREYATRKTVEEVYNRISKSSKSYWNGQIKIIPTNDQRWGFKDENDPRVTQFCGITGIETGEEE